ncbi:MAG: hypothetical protein H6868_05605 [Rhodospirillales bacterium]|nr:hypothetical protein [Rhodospirillales bacterium]
MKSMRNILSLRKKWESLPRQLSVGLCLLAMAVVFLLPAAAHAACSSPAANAGKMIYNTDASMAQYCDGTDWVAMGRKEMAALNADNMPTSGLVGYWKLDETSGTTAADSSGNGNTGTMAGGLDASTDSLPGKLANAFDFDGTDDYIRVSADPALNNLGSITVAAWFKPNNSDQAGLLGSINGEDGSSYNFLSVDAGGIQWTNETPVIGTAIRIGAATSVNNYTMLSSEFNQGDWIHVAYSYDGQSEKIYINGTVRKINSISGTLWGNAEYGLVIGKAYSTTTTESKGSIDDVRVYNRALDATEIACLAGAGPCNLTMGLVGHWKLDETSGTIAADSSGNGNNGTMAGGLDATNDSVPGKIGTALDFDGVDDYADFGDINALNFGPSDDFSIVLWIKTPSTNQPDTASTSNTIINKWNSTAAYPFGVRYYNHTHPGSGKYWIGRYDASNNPATTTSSTYNDDQWHHLSFVKNGGTLYLYMDGLLDNTVTDTTTGSMANTNHFTLGQRANGVYPYKGQIDDVRIYNRALSSSEIGQLYCQGVPGKIEYDADDHVMQFCSDQGLHPMGKALSPAPTICPNIGDVCPDGSVYAGEVLGTKLYVPPADQSASAKWYLWFSSQVTGATSNTDGASNQSIIVSNFSPLSNYPAFEVCENLSFAGHSDWFLPAISQLTVLYTNRVPIGGFSTDDYWSSTEFDGGAAKYKNFNTGISNTNSKADGGVHPIRCVRTGQPYSCFNPNGVEGQMIYNTDFNAMQYCNGVDWIKVGK